MLSGLQALLQPGNIGLSFNRVRKRYWMTVNDDLAARIMFIELNVDLHACLLLGVVLAARRVAQIDQQENRFGRSSMQVSSTNLS
jgi:hypothetical protein